LKQNKKGRKPEGKKCHNKTLSGKKSRLGRTPRSKKQVKELKVEEDVSESTPLTL
jgi:hypothetical protein